MRRDSCLGLQKKLSQKIWSEKVPFIVKQGKGGKITEGRGNNKFFLCDYERSAKRGGKSRLGDTGAGRKSKKQRGKWGRERNFAISQATLIRRRREEVL